MEKGIGFDWKSYMREELGMQEVNIESYSPLTLAYIGDCVYDLIIKTMVISVVLLALVGLFIRGIV